MILNKNLFVKKDNMRISKKVFQLIFILCLISTLFSQTGNKSKTVGKIGSKTYSYDEYDSQLKNYFDYWSKQGTKLTKEKEKELNNQYWEELIARSIYDAEIKRRKINPTEQQLIDFVSANPPQAIKNIKDLQTNAKFDKEKFKKAVTTNPEFKKNVLDFVREQYKYDRLFASIKAEAKIDQDSIYKAWKNKNTNATGKLIHFNIAKFAKLPVEEQEISAYYQENYETFKREPSRKYKYIKISNLPSIEDSLMAKTKVDSLYNELMKGADFAQMAALHSEDPGSGQKGGELGYFGKGRMVKEFEDACWSTQVGQISAPVKTRFGWHIIKVIDKRMNEKNEAEVSAAHILVKFTASKKTMMSNELKANQIFETAKNKGIMTAATEFAMQIAESEEFQETSKFVPGIGNYPEVYQFAFKNSVGTLYNQLVVNPRSNEKIVLEVSDSLGVHYAKLEDEKENIIRLIQRKKKLNAEIEYANAFVTKYQPAQYLEMAAQDSLAIIDFAEVTVDGSIPKVGVVKELNQSMLNTEKGKFTPVIKNDKAVYMALVENKNIATEALWTKVKTKEIKEAKEKLQTNHLNLWYANQKKKITVEDKRKDIYGL